MLLRSNHVSLISADQNHHHHHHLRNGRASRTNADHVEMSAMETTNAITNVFPWINAGEPPFLNFWFVYVWKQNFFWVFFYFEENIFFSLENFFFSSWNIFVLGFELFFTNFVYFLRLFLTYFSNVFLLPHFFSILEIIAMEMTSALWNVANRLSLNQIVVAVATKTVPEINHHLYGDVNQANPSITCKFRKPSSWVISYQIQICWNCIWTQILRLMQMESLDAFVWMTRLVLI